MDSDLQIPQAIPFGDITEWELSELSKLTGESEDDLQSAEDIQPVPNGLQKGALIPGVMDDFFTPMGRFIVDGKAFGDVTQEAATSSSIAKILAKLDELESAVKIAAEGQWTKTGGASGSNYYGAIAHMKRWLSDPIRNPAPFPIFVKGNKKLPFWQFSAPPDVTCPGAGTCLKKKDGTRGYCYSFSGWAKVFPFMRQLQNLLLLRINGGEFIRNAWMKLPKGTVVRLYVDGDFDTPATLDFWMDLCHERPDLKVYGYSKSWLWFTQRHAKRPNDWPSNYLVNISDASKFWNIPKVRDAMLKVPVVRGLFASIEVKKSHMPKLTKKQAKAGVSNKTLPGWKEHMKDVRDAAVDLNVTNWEPRTNAPVFSCPGLCADCLSGGRHACGAPEMRNITIVIGIH